MKSFSFRLDRVMRLRETSLRAEEEKLEQLRRGADRIERDRDAAEQAFERSRDSVQSDSSLRGSHLRALDFYRERAARERVAFARQMAVLAGETERQNKAVVEARRALRLLERLRERRLAEWRAASDYELEALSADFSTSQWLRNELRAPSPPSE
jgi:hypothetical protein